MRTVLLWALTALTAVQAAVSTTGRCGANNGGLTCAGSTFGNCCSQYGWCGSSTGHCGSGCDSAYGTCTQSDSTSKVSTDGSCGGTNGYTCQGSTFGNCCSQYGFCGSSSAYCGSGCKSAFGTCTNSQSSSNRASSTVPATRSSSVAVASPSASVKVSTNARCGNTFGASGGYSCVGSTWVSESMQLLSESALMEVAGRLLLAVRILRFRLRLLRNWLPKWLRKVHNDFIIVFGTVL